MFKNAGSSVRDLQVLGVRKPPHHHSAACPPRRSCGCGRQANETLGSGARCCTLLLSLVGLDSQRMEACAGVDAETTGYYHWVFDLLKTGFLLMFALVVNHDVIFDPPFGAYFFLGGGLDVRP